MPTLDPRGNGYKPRDWRHAYDAFLKFKTAVDTVSGRIGLGISTAGWSITVPGRFQGMADPRWRLTFTNIDGKLETIYIGSDAFTARNMIRELHKTYISMLVVRKPVPKTTNKGMSSTDPRFIHSYVERMRVKWNEMRNVRSVREWEANLAANPEVAKFMKARAGILPMTMEDYLFRHPMSAKWPTPPRSEKELQGRLKQDEDYLRSKERERINRGDFA